MRASGQSRAATYPLVFSVLCAAISSSITGVDAFQIECLRIHVHSRHHWHSHSSTTSSSSSSSALLAASKASPSLLDDDEYVSPNQIKALRKEVAKRRARKKLTQYKVPEAECTGDFSDDTLDAISDLLAKNELVEVRGISRNNKRNVFSTTEQLGMNLSELGKFVTTIEIKGFAATYYRPGDDDVEKRIIRRTNYKEGQWKKKRKPKRDKRGQIIPGEYEYFDE